MSNYTIISPLGGRLGPGTFDGLRDAKKFATIEEAVEAKEAVVINFVKDEEGIIYFEIYHLCNPDIKLYASLGVQHFIPSLGIDCRDDELAMELAQQMLDNPPFASE